MLSKEDIENFLLRIDKFGYLEHFEKIKIFGFYWTEILSNKEFTINDIKHLYEFADCTNPKNFKDLFNKLFSKNQIVVSGEGYRLERTIRESLLYLTDLPERRKIQEILYKLVNEIDEERKKKFLLEALNCYSVKADRAAIIMTWILTIDHLQDYILTHKVNEFNESLSKRKLKINEIKSKDDFSELNESDFIQICRETKIITNDVRKVLEEKLGIRNTYAHPATVEITETKTIDFIQDLVNNVILKYKI